MRVDEDVRSISGYLEAGRRAMDEHDQSSYDDGSYDETTYSRSRRSGFPQDSSALYSSPPSASTRRQSRRGAEPGSSSMAMDLENSYAPSPASRSRSRYQDDERVDDDDVQGESGDSVIDYGEAADGYDDGYEDDVGGRSSHSIGQNRGRASGLSDRGLDSRRQSSRFDLSGSAAPYDDDDQAPMDLGGGDMPSFNIDDSEGERDYGDGAVSGREEEDDEEDDDGRRDDEPEEPPRYYDDDDGGSERSRNDDDEDAEEVEGLAEVIEEDDPQRTPTQSSKRRGRPPKEGSAPRSVGRGKPKSLSEQGHFERERIASGRGRAGSVIDGDVRRSTRHRYAPLEYWRGERAIYGRPSLPSRPQRRPDSADADETIDENVFEEAPKKTYGVPVLREIIRYSRPPGEGTFTGLRLPNKKPVNGETRGRPPKRKMKRKKTAASDGDESDEEDEELDPTQPTRNPEDGWDDETDPHGTVWDADRQCEVERRIACPYSQVRAKPATNSSFSFEKVFGVDEYMASGILEIPVGGSKPTKPTKDNNYSFAIWQGGLDIRVHRTMFRLGPGGMFMVPKGNTYSIENCSQRKAVIWFTQARHPKGAPAPEGPIIQRYAPWPQTAAAAVEMSPATIKRERATSSAAAAEGGSGAKGRKKQAVASSSSPEIVASSSSGAGGSQAKKKKKGRPPKGRA